MEILSNRDSSASLGGARAARILVADDNSNIQRMVALALKDHGIDVVAVGNGEAAVRSMAQLAPDLILADVFMPVRSGYEVCDYVKKDSRYSHIPVVLLLGAFDPLDENEAKRVGADGVLKKPFVPPEPMIALVKALLEKSAPERLVPVPVPVAVGAGPETYATPEQPAFHAARVVPETLPPVQESPEIDFPPMGRDAFESAAPAAVASSEKFASATTAIEDTEVMTRQRDAELGEPAFWRPVEPEGATGETPEEEHGGARDFEPVEPKPGYFDAQVEDGAVAAAVAEPESSATAEPPAQAESESHDAIHAQSWAGPVTTPGTEEQTHHESSPQDGASNAIDAVITAPATVDSDSESSPASETEAVSDWPPAPHAPMIELGGSNESAFAPSSAVWSEPEPAAIESGPAESTTESNWTEESPATEPEHAEASPVSESPAQDVVAPVAKSSVELADTQKISPEMVELAAHTHEDPYLPEPPADEIVEDAPSESAAANEAPLAGGASGDELVNAVVARVIAKLQPQIAEMINEEILRPVVSALVRKEIDKQ